MRIALLVLTVIEGRRAGKEGRRCSRIERLNELDDRSSVAIAELKNAEGSKLPIGTEMIAATNWSKRMQETITRKDDRSRQMMSKEEEDDRSKKKKKRKIAAGRRRSQRATIEEEDNSSRKKKTFGGINTQNSSMQEDDDRCVGTTHNQRTKFVDAGEQRSMHRNDVESTILKHFKNSHKWSSR